MRSNIPIIVLLGAALAFVGCSADKRGEPNYSGKSATKLRFADLSQKSGVKFRHIPTLTPNKYMPEVLGSGLVISDFNRDGAPDVVLVNSGAVGVAERSEEAKTRIFINDGKGIFADKTEEWNLGSRGYGFGAAAGDFDNDGWTDLFLTSFDGDNRLLRNANGKFEDVTEKSGIANARAWTTSAGFGDFDSDGDLDLFIVRYVVYDTANVKKAYHNGILIYTPPYIYEAVPDQIWRNEGNGRFKDVSKETGIAESPQKGLALAIGDIDLDGDTDIYVANDTNPNQLWINDGKGKFKDMARLAGCAYSETGREEGSMGADFSDFDGNGLLDIAVPNFQGETTSLYKQESPMLFRDVSDAVGIGQSSRARLKFGLDFFDADNDGDEDLMVVNGHIEDNIEQNSDSITFAQLNSLYENLGNGRFADVSTAAGDALADKQVSRGFATADLDGDGDLDFIVSNNGGSAQTAINETVENGSFVIFWLEGGKSNRNAIGARIVARIGERKIERQIMGTQSYLSVSDFKVHLGLGPDRKIDEMTILWPGGETQVIKDVAAGKHYYLKQGANLLEYVPGEKQIP